MDIKEYSKLIKAKRKELDDLMTVSYTHLTLPTKA